MVTVQDWQEEKLVAAKQTALDRLRARAPLLAPYLTNEPLRNAADQLLQDLANWPGDYILLDPEEVDYLTKADFEIILATIDAADAKSMRAALQRACVVDAREVSVIGYTY